MGTVIISVSQVRKSLLNSLGVHIRPVWNPTQGEDSTSKLPSVPALQICPMAQLKVPMRNVFPPSQLLIHYWFKNSIWTKTCISVQLFFKKRHF